MTLEEYTQATVSEDQHYPLETMLLEALMEGKYDRRLILGFVNCAHVLETNPESVCLCVTPKDRYDDVTLQIYYTLIDAFCFEHNVPLIKVDQCKKLVKVLSDCKIVNEGGKMLGQTRPLREDDCYCVLIQVPSNQVGNEDHLLEFLSDYEQFGCPLPTVTLPG